VSLSGHVISPQNPARPSAAALNSTAPAFLHPNAKHDMGLNQAVMKLR
jgi:hypothetical protein